MVHPKGRKRRCKGEESERRCCSVGLVCLLGMQLLTGVRGKNAPPPLEERNPRGSVPVSEQRRPTCDWWLCRVLSVNRIIGSSVSRSSGAQMVGFRWDDDGELTPLFASKARNVVIREPETEDQDVRQTRSLSSKRGLEGTPNKGGWVPERYPNPLTNPTQCGISSLESDEAQSPLLCDPDSVLGPDYWHQVSTALRNFTASFSSPTPSFAEAKEGGTSNTNLDPSQLVDSSSPRDVPVQAADFRLLRDGATTSTRRGLGHLRISGRETPSSTEEHHPTSRHLGADLSQHATDAFLRPFSARSTIQINSLQLAVAVVRKMNLFAVLRGDSYFVYEDQDDMATDAAQYFSRYLDDAWWTADEVSNGVAGILIFVSEHDRVCYISSNTDISAILPWWRLDHVVTKIKPQLRQGENRVGEAVITAIHEIFLLVESGPPLLSERLHDFASRFGVVIGFALFTFLFAAWGEYRDRQRRWQYTELRSRLSPSDKEKARLLQREYCTRACPICLESFDRGSDSGHMSPKTSNGKERAAGQPLRRTDDYGIPLVGNDGLALKMLRCGHVFDETCWKHWVRSGYGNPLRCPVCRQDVGGNTGKRSSSSRRRTAPTTPTVHGRLLLSAHLFPNYSSVVALEGNPALPVERTGNNDGLDNAVAAGQLPASSVRASSPTETGLTRATEDACGQQTESGILLIDETPRGESIP